MVISDDARDTHHVSGLFKIHFVKGGSAMSEQCVNTEGPNTAIACADKRFAPEQDIESVQPVVCKYDNGARHDCVTGTGEGNPFVFA
jgi:hypothetical protein